MNRLVDAGARALPSHQLGGASAVRPFSLNEMQRQVLRTYCDGEVAYLVGVVSQEALNIELNRIGDRLLDLLLAELSDSEGCQTVEEALMRVRMALSDLDKVLSSLATVTPRAPLLPAYHEDRP